MQLLLLLSLILSAFSITFDRSSDSSESCEDTSEYHPHPHRPRPHRPRPPPHRPRPPPAELTKCPDTWMLFRRPQGNWCVTLFHKSQTWQGADNMCKTYGGRLTGLQTGQERMRLAEAARRIVQPLTPRNASVWIGARRKPECPRAGVCQDQNSFYWTDGHTTGTAGFQWAAFQPDGLVEGKFGVQSCARLAVFSGGSAASPRHGAYDDYTCEYLPSRVTLVACGKKATRY
ncbi:hypothetical protein GCK72_003526 [Caenorhabditis remanei]|uniref:C-type lectin domain-containing protein n=1 Tax=Caenorhabditis remanei TaxID=31234 RepID=A0A6A5HV49_CAERE|nr:hypothetical protein GCK72_003526 [Caenorhabditis remanei]KAF1771699.1 hypothetical protein GCK72_003526 [Caenorhabditis remanei]